VKEWETVLLDSRDGVATITLNRPDKANAFTRQLVSELGEVMQKVAAANDVRAVILTGSGKTFSAGGDMDGNVNTLGQMSPTEFNAFFKRLEVLFLTMTEMEKPIICALNGHAMAGGLELALASDIRIASEKAKFGVLFVLVSLAPEVCLHILPRLVGMGKAKLLSMTGEIIDAHEAYQIGLVDRVVAADELMANAVEMAVKLANGPVAVGRIKQAYNETAALDFRATMAYAGRLMYQLVHTEDYQEGLDAYSEKRPPRFSGK